jgi:hypothetical protein
MLVLRRETHCTFCTLYFESTKYEKYNFHPDNMDPYFNIGNICASMRIVYRISSLDIYNKLGFKLVIRHDCRDVNM